MRTWLAVWLVAVSLAPGCVRRADAPGASPRVDSRRIHSLYEVASRDIGCPTAALAIQPLTDRVYQVGGCGVTREYAIVGRGRGRYRGARWVAIAPVVERAGSEMACDRSMLAIGAPAPTSRVVTGCGRSASYAIVCSEVDCAWVITSHAGAWASSDTAAIPAGAGAQGAIVVVGRERPPSVVPIATTPAPSRPDAP
jgi:hypothetical protein